MNWFDANFYLESKLAQLQSKGEFEGKTANDVKAAIEAAGMTVEEHFMQFHTAELTSPCEEFNTVQYINAKVAQLNAAEEGGRADWTFEQVQEALEGVGGAYQHYEMFGSKEGINPSNDFDASAYLDAKAEAMGEGWTAEKVAEAIENAGMSVLDHFMMFAGKGEGEVAADASFEVPAGEQVSETPVVPTPENPLAALLQGLTNANAAKAEFLNSLELDTDFDGNIDVEAGDATDQNVADTLTTAKDNVATEVSNNLTSVTADQYKAASDNVKEAHISDAKDTLNETLTTQQKAIAAAEAKIAKVEGLNEAVDALHSALTAETNAVNAAKIALADQAGAEASYETLNSKESAPVEIEIDAKNGTVTDLIILKDGKIVLADGVTEKDNPGVTALLDAINARLTADKAVTDAQNTVKDAQNVVDHLDLNTQAVTALKALAADMELKGDDLPTVAEINDHLASLKADAEVTYEKAATTHITVAKDFTAKAADGSDLIVADGESLKLHDNITSPTEAQTALLNDLKAALEFSKKIATFDDKADDNNPLLDELDGAQSDADQTQESIKDLNDALANLSAAQDNADQLAALQKIVDTAEKAFTDDDFNTPVTLDSAHSDQTASAKSDIFVAHDADASIDYFGDFGEDVLYVADAQYNDTVIGKGEDQTELGKAGDDSVTEFFFEQSGKDVIVHIEQKAFASSETVAENEHNSDMVEITLTGVSVDDLTVADGFITMA